MLKYGKTEEKEKVFLSNTYRKFISVHAWTYFQLSWNSWEWWGPSIIMHDALCSSWHGMAWESHKTKLWLKGKQQKH